MLRSLTLAALLLITLFWTMTAVAATGNVRAPLQSVAQVGSIDANTAVTPTGLITVTTTDDELNSDGDCSLREAIQAAAVDKVVDLCPADSGSDTIVLPAGRYFLSLGQLEISGTVTISGSTVGTSIIDGGQQSRVLYIYPDSTVNLLHLDIRNGQGTEGGCCLPSAVGMGGGIANYGATLIAYSTIQYNKAGSYSYSPYDSNWAPGGGIYNEGSLTVANSTISNNAGGSGGGIHNGGSTTITNSAILDNQSRSMGGGGIYNEGTLVITSSTISHNDGGDGGCSNQGHDFAYCISGGAGGGINNTGILSVNNSTINANIAGDANCHRLPEGLAPCGSGGAGGGINNNGTLTIINSTISANVPGDGGCIQIDAAVLDCSDVGEGGGVSTAGILRLENSTIAKNVRSKSVTISTLTGPFVASAIISYGIVGGLYMHGGVVTLKNDILADNQGNDCGGQVNSLGYNIIQSTAGCSIQGSYIHWGAHIGSLRDNGGPTLTHALDKKSPAIDAGTCTNSAGVTVTEDQRGKPRPQADGCDIGAYESPYTSTFAIQKMSLPLIDR